MSKYRESNRGADRATGNSFSDSNFSLLIHFLPRSLGGVLHHSFDKIRRFAGRAFGLAQIHAERTHCSIRHLDGSTLQGVNRALLFRDDLRLFFAFRLPGERVCHLDAFCLGRGFLFFRSVFCRPAKRVNYISH